MARLLKYLTRPRLDSFNHSVEYGPVNLDHTLLALANPTRRAILARLAIGEARVTEIARPFGISLNAVSKHIQMLERAQLVVRRRQGREHLLSFNRKPLDAATHWMENQRTLWTARLETLDQLLTKEDRA